MLTLFVYKPGYDLPSMSPFCIKSMVLLRLSGVDHQVKIGDPRSSPTGKLPCLKHDDGVLPDSSHIQTWLKEHHEVDLDAHLSPQDRALGHLVQRTVEDGLYWVLVYGRWVDDTGWVHMGPMLKTMVPAAVSWFLPAVLRKGVKKSLFAQGTGRHASEEIYAAGVADLDALEAMIKGPGPFLFGEELSTYDIVVHSFLSAARTNPAASPLRDKARACTKLVALSDAVHARYLAAG